MILLMRIICDFSYLYSDIKKYLDLFLVANSERLTETLGKTKKSTPKQTKTNKSKNPLRISKQVDSFSCRKICLYLET